MIRVAFVKQHGFHLGGTEILLQRFSAYLDKSRYQVSYYSQPPFIESQVQFLQDNGVTVYYGQPIIGYDLIHSVQGDPTPLPDDTPLVESVTLICPGQIRKRKADWSIHMSAYQRNRWMWHGYGWPWKSSVIPSPIDRFETDENLRGSLGIEPEAVVTGLIQRDDGHIYSPWPLEAYRECQGPNRYFLVCGGSDKYAHQGKDLNNAFWVSGATPYDVCRFYNTLDFLTHGRSDGETYGTAIADALAHGLPILTHRAICNGQRETVNRAGFYCWNRGSYRKAMRQLFEDSALRFNLSKIASEQAKAYSRDRCMKQLEDVYERVLR